MSKENFKQLLTSVNTLSSTQKNELYQAFNTWSDEVKEIVSKDTFTFTECHLHTEFSLLDGVDNVKSYFAKAKEFGYPALAITDHRVTHGWYPWRDASGFDLKPIFGCEVEVESPLEDSEPEYNKKGELVVKHGDPEHLVLLAKNNVGYANILKIVAWSSLENFYRKPLAKREIIEEYSEGIIASSACLGGIINKTIIRGQKNKKLILKSEIFACEQNITELKTKLANLSLDREKNLEADVQDEDTNSSNQEMETFLNEQIAETESLLNEKLLEFDTLNSKLNEMVKFTEEEIVAMEEEMLEKAYFWKSIFGENFYLEVQDFNNPDACSNKELEFIYMQNLANSIVYKISEKTGIPLIATNDVHYVNKGEHVEQDILIAINTGKTLNDPELFTLPSHEHYMKDKWTMLWKFKDHPEAVLNTMTIADACEVTYETEYQLPKHPHLPEGVTEREFFVQKTWDGVKSFYAKPENYVPLLEKFNCSKAELWKTIKDRTQYEIDVIAGMGFEGYILIVSRCVDIPKEHGWLVGPGRGSAAGSIVALGNGITNVCPLRYDLIFERFLNPDRIEMPDIDVDYQYEHREEVIKLITEEIGADKTAQILTRGTMKARGAIRAVGKVLDIPLKTVDKIAKLIPFGFNLKKALEESIAFKKVYDENQMITADFSTQDLIDISIKVENKPKSYSVHAAGVILSGKPVVSAAALQKGKALPVIQAEMSAVDGLRLVKQDFLGLRNLTIIALCIESIKQRHGIEIDPYNIPRDDKATFEMLSRGESVACFQLESVGMRQLLVDMNIEKIEDIVDCIALYRPGVLSVGMHTEYVLNKHNPSHTTYIHPSLEPILAPSRGILIYQEQAMMIANKVAGFSMAEADKLRKAIGKKKFEIMEGLKIKFVEGCWNVTGIEKEVAESIWHLIEVMAGYSFNKSHSVGYAFVSNDTAYLKCHYPIEYMTGALTVVASGKSPKLPLYIQETKRLGINIVSPDINLSEEWFSIKEVDGKDSIIFGLAAVKEVGKNAKIIVDERNANGDFKDVIDFRIRCPKVDKTALVSLIKGGCFDFTGINRNAILDKIDEILKIKPKKPKKSAKSKKSKVEQIPLPDFDSLNEIILKDSPLSEIAISFGDIAEPTKEEISYIEEELFSTYISYHPLEGVKSLMDTKITHSAENLEETDLREGQTVIMGGLVKERKAIITKNGQDMAFYSIDDMTGIINCVAFPNDFEKFKDIPEKSIVLIKGKTQFKEKFKPSNNDSKDNEDDAVEEVEYEVQIIVQDMVIFNQNVENNFSKQQPKNEQYNVPKSDSFYEEVPVAATLDKIITLQDYLNSFNNPQLKVL